MKSNYDVLGKHIKLVDIRNRDKITDRVLGINIDKFFMPSVANVIGTDLSSYKLLSRGRFACSGYLLLFTTRTSLLLFLQHILCLR